MVLSVVITENEADRRHEQVFGHFSENPLKFASSRGNFSKTLRIGFFTSDRFKT